MKSAFIALAIVFAVTLASAQTTTETAKSIYDVPVLRMVADSGVTTTLAEHRGKVLLIVNVASKCGFTGQYKGLEDLNDKYRDKGLRVLGFPCNDFGSQEPGTETEIVEFCRSKFDVSFPLYAKVHAKDEKSPLYAFLTEATSDKGDVKWNFEKFVVARDGSVVARFRSKVSPDAPELVQAIERELEKRN